MESTWPSVAWTLGIMIILVSNHVHQYVCQMDIPGLKFEDWGQVIVKHGSTVHMWTAYGPGFGRTEFPDWRGTKRVELE